MQLHNGMLVGRTGLENRVQIIFALSMPDSPHKKLAAATQSFCLFLDLALSRPGIIIAPMQDRFDFFCLLRPTICGHLRSCPPFLSKQVGI